ncbi:MAG: hypothetical protein V7642_7169 [Burkholderiales bacterium]|jgi:hypothetical protein
MTKIPEQAKVYPSVTTGINENTLKAPTGQPELKVADTTPQLTNEEKRRQAARGRAKLESKFNNNARPEKPPVITFDKVMNHIEAEPVGRYSDRRSGARLVGKQTMLVDVR